MAEFIS